LYKGNNGTDIPQRPQTSTRTGLLGALTLVHMAQSTRRRGILLFPRLSDWPLLT